MLKQQWELCSTSCWEPFWNLKTKRLLQIIFGAPPISTIVAISPVIKEIEQQNNELQLPKEELQSLIRKMVEGTQLVFECSKIRWLHFVTRACYKDKLDWFFDELEKLFAIDMQAQMARDLRRHCLRNMLGRSQQELEPLIQLLRKSKEVVYKCSKIGKYNFVAKNSYHSIERFFNMEMLALIARDQLEILLREQLEALADSLVRFFIIDMQAQMARDQKEILLKVRRILSTVNKFPFHTVDASNPEENAILLWKQQIQVCLCPAILILSLSRCIYVCMIRTPSHQQWRKKTQQLQRWKPQKRGCILK
ncbi:hypothetical protein HKD37_03G006492 [Glycine soja]